MGSVPCWGRDEWGEEEGGSGLCEVKWRGGGRRVEGKGGRGVGVRGGGCKKGLRGVGESGRAEGCIFLMRS